MIAQKVGTFLVETAGPRIREDDGRIAPSNPVLGVCLERNIWIPMDFVIPAFGIGISAFELILCNEYTRLKSMIGCHPMRKLPRLDTTFGNWSRY